MFRLPPPQGVLRDGSSDEHPIFLEGVSKIDFRWLLQAMHPPPRNSPIEYPSKDDNEYDSKDYDECDSIHLLYCQWSSVLELSCMWQMVDVRQKVVKEILQLQDRITTDDQVHLLKLSTKLEITEIRDRSIQELSWVFCEVKLVQLGMELQAESLVRSGFKQLVEGPANISMEHAELLGRETTSKLLRIRDEYLRPTRRHHFDVTNEIQLVFAEELQDGMGGR
jgi:hypothetical protein